MTTSSTRSTRATWPGLYDLPAGPRNRLATPIARGLFHEVDDRRIGIIRMMEQNLSMSDHFED